MRYKQNGTDLKDIYAVADSNIKSSLKFKLSDYKFNGDDENIEFVKYSSTDRPGFWGGLYPSSTGYQYNNTDLPFARKKDIPTRFTPEVISSESSSTTINIQYLELNNYNSWLNYAISYGYTEVHNLLNTYGEGLYQCDSAGKPTKYLTSSHISIIEIQAPGGSGGSRHDPAIGWQKSGSGGGGGGFVRIILFLGFPKTYAAARFTTTSFALGTWSSYPPTTWSEASAYSISVGKGGTATKASSSAFGTPGAGGEVKWADGSKVEKNKSDTDQIIIADVFSGCSGGRGGNNSANVNTEAHLLSQDGVSFSGVVNCGGIVNNITTEWSGGISGPRVNGHERGGGGGASASGQGRSADGSTPLGYGGGGAGQNAGSGGTQSGNNGKITVRVIS